MSTFTPSATSSGIAGFTFWGMCWTALAKIDKIAELFHVSRWVKSKNVFGWILKNKALSILCSEIVNYSIHGVQSTLGVTFAIGGTVCNALMIFIGLPVINKVKGNPWS
jgi:hypothetical protein